MSSTNASRIKIEVCIDSLESAHAAIEGGADRLEICGNLALGGGTTPSIGLVRMVKKICPANIELMAMIRPRTGDFLYSDSELEVMLDDINAFYEVGVTGVVLGALCADGTVDSAKTKMLVDSAVKRGLQVCFHRAIDMTPDIYEALATLKRITGITRILTSGGAKSVPKGLTTLERLCTKLEEGPSSAHLNQVQAHSSPKLNPDSGIEIMPGAGISAQSVTPVLCALLPLGVRSVHLSGGSFVSSSLLQERIELESENPVEESDGANKGMKFRKEGMGMGVGGEGEWGVWRTSSSAIRALRTVVDREWDVFTEEKTILLHE